MLKGKHCLNGKQETIVLKPCSIYNAMKSNTIFLLVRNRQTSRGKSIRMEQFGLQISPLFLHYRQRDEGQNQVVWCKVSEDNKSESQVVHQEVESLLQNDFNNVL